jgi:hypothetical protein
MPLLTKKQNDARINNNVHTILFNRNIFSKNDVNKLLDLLGYNKNPIHTTKNFYRVRQFNPGSFRSHPKYFTVLHKNIPGIEFVIEY